MRLFASYSFIALSAISLTSLGNDEEGNDSGKAPSTVVAVDLGLPSGTKWADRNVGATSPEYYGDYFAWGETSTKGSFIEKNSLTYGAGSYGYYWSSKALDDDSNGAYVMSLDSGNFSWGYWYYSYYGQPVRPVSK